MERKRTRTVLSKQAYAAIGASGKESRPQPWAPESVKFVNHGGTRMLLFFFSRQQGSDVPLGLPVDGIEELKEAKLAELKTARLSPSHTAVIVDGVDAFVSVEGLFRDFSANSPAVRALIARTFAANGGMATSEAKKRSSAENGKKGGIRKKQPEHALASDHSKN